MTAVTVTAHRIVFPLVPAMGIVLPILKLAQIGVVAHWTWLWVLSPVIFQALSRLTHTYFQEKKKARGSLEGGQDPLKGAVCTYPSPSSREGGEERL